MKRSYLEDRRGALVSAEAILNREGNRTMLVLAVILVTAASFLPTMLIGWTSTYLLDWNAMSEGLYGFLSLAQSVLCYVVLFLTASPLYLGLYRLAVMTAREDTPPLLELFYYYADKRLYRRSLALVWRVMLRLLPLYLFFVGLLGAFTATPDAETLFGGLIVACILVPPLLWLTSLFFAPLGGLVTLAVSREDMTVRECLRMAKAISHGKKGENIKFFFSLAWRMLVSFIPVAVPLIVHTLPFALLANVNYVDRTVMADASQNQ